MVESTTVTVKRYRFRWTLNKERWYPLVLAVVATLGGCFLKTVVSVESVVFSSSVVLGAIVAGFSGTCLSVLIGLGTRIMEQIRKSNVVSILSNYLGHAIFSGVLLSLISIVGLLTKTSEESAVEVWVFVIWCGVGTYCLSCFCRLAIIMLRVFSHPYNQPKS